MMGGRNASTAAAAAGMACLLAYAAWKFGLYFDADAYGVELIVFAAGAVGAVNMWKTADKARLAGLLPLGVSVCYAAVLAAGPASVQGTVDAALRWAAYAGWLTAVAAWSRTTGRRAPGEAAIQAAGVFLLLGGWLGWFGVLSFPEMVQRFSDPELSSTGARLGGFLQYPNTYGAVMAFFLVRQWQIWAGTDSRPASGRLPEGDGDRRAGIRKGIALASSLLSVLYAGALALTESRGAMIALLVGFGLALLLAEEQRVRMRLILAGAWTVAGAASAALAAWWSLESGSPAGPRVTAAAAAAGAAALYGVWLWLEKAERRCGERDKRPYARPAAAAGAALLACGALFAWNGGLGAGARLTGAHVQTAASRLLFYRDAWRMFGDAPWLGRGGDAWRSLYGLYQSQPYVGSQVHSGYLDMLLDTGLAGLAAFAGMLGYLLWRTLRVHRAAAAPATVLLVHAAVDFDMSYGWIWLLLFAWFALFTAEDRPERRPGEGPPGGWRAGAWRPAAARVAAVLLAGASAWGAWAAWHGYAAAQAAAAAERAATPGAREALLRAALEANPAAGGIRLTLAPLLPQGERERVLAAGLRYEPQSAPLLLELGLAEAERMELARAEPRLREALRLDRYNRRAHTAAIAAMTLLAEALRFDGRAEEARRADEAAVAFYERYLQLVREVEAMDNPANGRQFGMTGSATFHAARSLAALDRADEARTLLKQLVRAQGDSWSAMARELLNEIDRQAPVREGGPPSGG